MRLYVVHFESGVVTDPVDLDSVRGMIEAEILGPGDRVSIDDGQPLPWTAFEELADLDQAEPDDAIPDVPDGPAEEERPTPSGEAPDEPADAAPRLDYVSIEDDDGPQPDDSAGEEPTDPDEFDLANLLDEELASLNAQDGFTLDTALDSDPSDDTDPDFAPPGAPSSEFAPPGAQAEDDSTPADSAPPARDPENSAPGTSSPGASGPGTSSPGISSPGTSSPGTSSPGTSSPGTSSPGTSSPGTSSPGTSSPGASSPGQDADLWDDEDITGFRPPAFATVEPADDEDDAEAILEALDPEGTRDFFPGPAEDDRPVELPELEEETEEEEAAEEAAEELTEAIGALLGDMGIPVKTVRDQLFQASLYEVLSTAADVSGQDLSQAYLEQVNLIDARQRMIVGDDLSLLTAVEDLRRLTYQAFVKLSDSKQRREYDRVAERVGSLLPAASYLGLRKVDATSQSFLDSGTYAQHKAKTGQSSIPPDRSKESVSTKAAPDGAPGAYVRQRRVRQRRTGEVVLPTPISERRRDALEKAITQRQLKAADDSPVLQADLMRTKAKWDRTNAGSGGFLVADPVLPAAAGAARKSVLETRGAGMLQVVSLCLLALLVPSILAFESDWGATELEMSGPSLLFWLRGGLLMILAVLGTLLMRREALWSLGFRPAIPDLLLGAVLGLALGIASGYVAPIWVKNPVETWVVALFFLFQAVSQEIFFRGFVTRVLLAEFSKAPFVAIVISSLLYGTFYLTFFSTQQLDAYFVFFFSILVPGLIMGSLFGWLYWKSRSLWPSIVTQFLILFLAYAIPAAA